MRKNNGIEDIYQVLHDMVSNSRQSSVGLAEELFPHLKYESRNSRLAACFSRDPSKREELTINQLIKAMKFCDSYLPLHYICEETSHYRPERKPIDEVESRLAKAVADAAEAVKASAEVVRVAVAALEKHKAR